MERTRLFPAGAGWKTMPDQPGGMALDKNPDSPAGTGLGTIPEPPGGTALDKNPDFPAGAEVKKIPALPLWCPVFLPTMQTRREAGQIRLLQIPMIPSWGKAGRTRMTDFRGETAVVRNQ